ncbi:hypothetical protein HMPREF0391_10929 [Finegoldia magna ATCC 53516]|uniref:Uncharacterized protein n=1 Tax=Finegoldia magna ATCC 53516 TaxID=525282 RepID=D6S8Z3_FINMA|nr:hypothetical protein HMPREF0391_10929 [Finegoldia magna ATCC 53516]
MRRDSFIKIYPEWNVNVGLGIAGAFLAWIKIYPEWNVNISEMVEILVLWD